MRVIFGNDKGEKGAIYYDGLAHNFITCTFVKGFCKWFSRRNSLQNRFREDFKSAIDIQGLALIMVGFRVLAQPTERVP